MILRVVSNVGCLMAAALCAGPACADVLEIGGDGEARWIAGPLSLSVEALSTPTEEAALMGEVPAELAAIPDSVIANLAAQAGLVPQAYVAKVHELAARFDLSPTLIEALVWQESRWRANAVSPVGAQGLAQLMPGTARELGVDPADPFANLEGGARYLRAQMDRFDGDLEKALAAYNAGPGRVARANGVPAIRETQLYVAAIMGRLSNHSRSPN
ncbi:MAG: lytic transglycosylase domain-containing protein [Croceibacterium sp.]